MTWECLAWSRIPSSNDLPTITFKVEAGSNERNKTNKDCIPFESSLQELKQLGGPASYSLPRRINITM